jgi:spore coat polysaccharide biosynthesis protein SpsF (cytidylyltransferase family)
MSNIIAIIQARVSSTRLANKIMLDISGKPLIWHIINRVSKVKSIDKIIVATTTNSDDNIIVDFCKINSIVVFRGSENDVLDRYYQAAKKYLADVIVRVTGDDPLTDPKVIGKVIKCFLDERGKVDYVSNNLKATYPEGLDVEVFSFAALEKAWKNAQLPSEREHVSPYIKNHSEIFSLKNVECEKDLSNLRWTVDYEKDYIFVKKVYQKLYTSTNNGVFSMEDVLDLLQKEPQLMEINKNVLRAEGYIKSLKMDEKLSKGGR